MTATSVILAIAAIVQASAAIAIWKLTGRLATATETYARETKRMVDEISEQRKHQQAADVRAAGGRIIHALNRFQGILNQLHTVESEHDTAIGVDKNALSAEQLEMRRSNINFMAASRLLDATYEFAVSFSDEFGAFSAELFRRGMVLSRIINVASRELREGRLDIDGSCKALTHAQASLAAEFSILRQQGEEPPNSELPEEADIVGWIHCHRDD